MSKNPVTVTYVDETTAALAAWKMADDKLAAATMTRYAYTVGLYVAHSCNNAATARALESLGRGTAANYKKTVRDAVKRATDRGVSVPSFSPDQWEIVAQLADDATANDAKIRLGIQIVNGLIQADDTRETLPADVVRSAVAKWVADHDVADRVDGEAVVAGLELSGAWNVDTDEDEDEDEGDEDGTDEDEDEGDEDEDDTGDDEGDEDEGEDDTERRNVDGGQDSKDKRVQAAMSILASRDDRTDMLAVLISNLIHDMQNLSPDQFGIVADAVAAWEAATTVRKVA